MRKHLIHCLGLLLLTLAIPACGGEVEADSDDAPAVDPELLAEFKGKCQHIVESGGSATDEDKAEVRRLRDAIAEDVGEEAAINELKQVVENETYGIIALFMLRGLMPGEQVDAYAAEVLEPAMLEIYNAHKSDW